MRLFLLLMTVSCLGSMERESYKPAIPMLYWYNTHIALDHPDGPIHLSVRLKMAAIPEENIVRVGLRVMHKGKLMGGRETTIQWEDWRKFEE